MFEKLHSESLAETEKIGAKLAMMIVDDPALPRFVALYGDLGVGKTAFVRGFASAIAPSAHVKSPTFAIVNEYRSDSMSIFHFDMYRINDDDDLYSTGYYDYLKQKKAVCLTEWSEKIPFALPDSYFKVTIEKDSIALPDSRNITLELIEL